MLRKPIGVTGPLMAANDGAPAGGGGAPADPAGQAGIAEPAGTTPPADPQGQVGAQAPAAPAGQVNEAGSGVPENTPPYFEYTWEDGRKDTHLTEQDHKNAWRDSFLRREKWTQDMQKLSTGQAELKSNQARYDTEYTSFLQEKQKQDGMSSALDSLSEQEFQKLMGMVSANQQQQGQYQLPPEVTQQLQEFADFKKESTAENRERDTADKRTAVYGQLGKELGSDFQAEAVQTEIDRLRNVSPDEQMREFAMLVHYAMIGRTKPGDLAAQAEANLRNKGGSLPAAPPQGSPPGKPAGEHGGALTEDEAGNMSMAEITARAKKQAGV